MRKDLNELTELEKKIVQDFVQNPQPGLGIETVVFTAEESYVVFTGSTS